jgi:23S rRNA (adenine1618-N6)-methyltransferase
MNKIGLHPKNKHKSNYEFNELIQSYPPLKEFVAKNKYGTDSIDFSNGKAVMALNAALLKHFYQVNFWEIPKDYLCPPIPGRADYIHHLADRMSDHLKNHAGDVYVLDIGVGANCVYPLIGNAEYNWKFVGSDIDSTALKNAQNIIDKNKLNDRIELRLQADKTKIFEGIINPDEFYSFVVCNPPFHESLSAAKEGTNKKNKNLGLKKDNQNFGGVGNELWCEGGELSFIKQMIFESIDYRDNVAWFTTLVSKSTTLPLLYEELKNQNINKVRTIDMAQGQKKTRVLAWRF